VYAAGQLAVRSPPILSPSQCFDKKHMHHNIMQLSAPVGRFLLPGTALLGTFELLHLGCWCLFACVQVFRRAAASVVTLGSGASLGPEAPSVELGANTAAVLAPKHLSKRRQRMLVAAGAAAGALPGG
jgi:hypothetical protein